MVYSRRGGIEGLEAGGRGIPHPLFRLGALGLVRIKERETYGSCGGVMDKIIIIVMMMKMQMPQGLVLHKYRVFIKYCVFSKIFKYISDFGLTLFSLGFRFSLPIEHCFITLREFLFICVCTFACIYI